MAAAHPAGPLPGMAQGRRPADLGEVLRQIRRSLGFSQTILGQRLHCSASTISRMETGKQPLTIDVLQRLIALPGVASEALQLLLPPRHALDLIVDSSVPSTATVVKIGPCESGDDSVRRRELLAGGAGLAGVAAFGLPETASADQAGSLEDLLYGTVEDGIPVPLLTLEHAAAKARRQFQGARYDDLGQQLPQLISSATTTRHHANSGDTSQASALLADAYITASLFMVKLNDDRLAWATADRAVQAAQASGDPLTLADARRCVATVLRRIGKPAKASDLLLSAARDIEPAAQATADQLSMYGTLLQIAAYTAAVDGNRHAAHEYITEATTAAARLGYDGNHRFTAFGPTNVTVFQVSIAQVLGDNGTAIEHAQALRPGAIPNPERRGRYWIDVARAYHQWGKHEACYRALRAAERAAPAEVRYRPPVHRMTEHLLRADRGETLPGLRAFAARVGVSA